MLYGTINCIYADIRYASALIAHKDIYPDDNFEEIQQALF